MRQQQQQEESTPQATGFWKWPGWHRTDHAPVVTSETASTTESVAAAQIAQLEQTIRQRKRNLRRSHFAQIGAFVALIAIGLLAPLSQYFVSADGHSLQALTDGINSFIFTFYVLIATSLGLSAVSIFSLLRGTRRLRQAADALANTDDLHAVGPLIEALRFPGRAHDAAAIALARLLPRLNSQDTVQLNAEQHARLLKELRASANPRSLASYNPHFAVTLLHALEKIQDSIALPLVTQLAQSRGSKPAQESIRLAAQECLSVLSGHTVSSNRLHAAGPELREEPEAAAETRLSRVQPETVETLMAQLHQDARTYKRRLLISIVGAGIGVIGVLAMTVLATMLRENLPVGCAAFLYAMMMVGILGIQYSASRTRGAVSALADTDDLRVVGQLIEALEISDGWLKRMAIATLTRLLRRLQASDAALLNDTQRAILCRCLDRWAMDKRDQKKSELAIAILKALAQIGDAQAVPSVQRLASFAAKTPAQRRVRDEAAACLPFLTVRADQQHASQTLLRAATASAEPSELLLRPATNASAADSQTLLRPGHSLDVAEVRMNGESKGTL